MTFRLSLTVRRMTIAGLASLGVAGAVGSAAETASAASSSCASLEHVYANRNIAKVTLAHRERTAWCVINDARRQNGAPALKDTPIARSR